MNKSIDVHEVFARYFTGAEALAYAISKTLADGSICLDLAVLKNSIENNDELWQANPFREHAKPFDDMIREGLFVTHKADELKPFVIHKGKAYLHRYFTYETRIIDHIRRLGDRFRVITGGPGTGKTYSLAMKLADMFENKSDLKAALAAPTGKAAARMEEAIRQFAASQHEKPLNKEIIDKLNSLKAQTLHRLLGYNRNSINFRHKTTNPLPFDVVIVDEASMIDGAMMAKLLDAIGENTTLFLVGDKDQLASVEAGSVFGDICRAKDSTLIEDKVEVKVENWRAKKSPLLIEFSEKIIAGKQDFITAYENNNEVVVDTQYAETLFHEQIRLYKEYITEQDIKTALKKLNRVRVLCVTREHDHSVAEANSRIEKFLKKEVNDSMLFSPREGFYHNQPIIITKNDYNLGVNNGDVGLIRRDGEVLKAWFEDAEKEAGYKVIPAGYLNHYETVFAMTIHKSQGSEFDHVVVLLPEKQARKLLTRELLYTAVTRARKQVLLQSTPESLAHCIEAVVSRASGLTERIKNA